MEMADNTGYAGVTLDLIFLDEDILDGEFDEEITRDIRGEKCTFFYYLYREKHKLQRWLIPAPTHKLHA